MTRIAIISDLAEAAELLSMACPDDDVTPIEARARTDDEVVDELQASGAAVVVIGPELDEARTIELARDIDRRVPGTGRVLWAEPTANLLMQAIAAGVRGVLPGNPSLDDLSTAIHGALDAGGRSAGQEPTQPRRTGRVVVVTSPKGGTGKTTVAVNLAVALGVGSDLKVALVDLDLQFGDVEYALRLRPETTMTDAVKLGGHLDSTSVKGCLTPHPSGVFALCAPSNPVEAEQLDPDRVAEVVRLMSEIFDLVVVDTGAGIDDHLLNAMDLATDVVLLVATDVPTVRSAQKSLPVFDRLGYGSRAWHIVLNRSDAKVGLGPEDVEQAIGLAIDSRIPESRAMGAAMNHGSPVVESQPKSPPAKALTLFARRFLEPVAVSPAASSIFDRVGAF